MKTIILTAVSALCLTVSTTFGQVVALLTDSLGDSLSVTIQPGDSFTFDFSILSDEPLIGATYFLSATGISNSAFTITSRTITGSLFSSLQTIDPTALAANPVLSPANGSDLGALVANLSIPATPGLLYFSSITLTSSPAINFGVYTINITPSSIVLNSNFDEISITSSYTVNVIPEPTTFALLGLGSVLALGARRRRSSLK